MQWYGRSIKLLQTEVSDFCCFDQIAFLKFQEFSLAFNWPIRVVKGSHFETKEAQAYLLWGQALLKLARTYFVPDANLGKDEYLKCLTLSMEKFNQSAKILERKLHANNSSYKSKSVSKIV